MKGSSAEASQEFMDSQNRLFIISLCINGGIFVIFTLITAFIFIKLKLQLDKSAIATIITFFLCFLVRFSNWIFSYQMGNRDMMSYFLLPELIATQAVGLIQYYFIFEMKQVQNKLESQSFTEYKLQEKRTYCIRNFIMAFYTIDFLVIFGVYLYKILREQQEFSAPSYWIIIIAKILKFLFIDVFVAVMLMRLMVYFSTKKIKKQKTINQKMSCFKLTCIIWAYFIIIMIFMNQVLHLIIGSLIVSKLDDNSIYTQMYEILRFFITPLTDFITGTSLAFLFYYQANIALQMKRTQNKVENRFNNGSQVARRNYDTQSIIGLLKQDIESDKSEVLQETRRSIGPSIAEVQSSEKAAVTSSKGTKQGSCFEDNSSLDEENHFRSFLYSQITISKYKNVSYEKFKEQIFKKL